MNGPLEVKIKQVGASEMFSMARGGWNEGQKCWVEKLTLFATKFTQNRRDRGPLPGPIGGLKNNQSS
jgi:hypothetical protein